MTKATRKKLGISQNGLAKLVGVSNQALSKWETMEGSLTFRDSKTKENLLAVIKMTKERA